MCLSPKRLKHPTDFGSFIDVPCGRCYECVRKRKMLWQVRIMSELSVSDCAFFSLISYNEENLPDPMKYDKPALQLLIKRLRTQLKRYYGNHVQLKYFIVSEYGEMKNRLHYHSIWFVNGVFLDRFQWKRLLEDEWKKGFCSAFYLTNTWASYACKYIQKGYNMIMYSRLGKKAYLDSCGGVFIGDYDTFDIPYYAVRGKSFPIPRSWRDSLIVKIPGSSVDSASYFSVAYRFQALNNESRQPYNVRHLLQYKYEKDENR